MTIEKSLGRIEAMLCELLEIAREQDGESTASVDPHSSLKRVRAESGSSVDSAEGSSTSDGIDIDNIVESPIRSKRGREGNDKELLVLQAVRNAKRHKRVATVLSGSSGDDDDRSNGVPTRSLHKNVYSSVVRTGVKRKTVYSDDASSIGDFIVNDSVDV